MAQRISHLYRIVTVPAFYSAFKDLLDAQSAQKHRIAQHYRIPDGARVLDVGCGPADLLALLPPCDYTGVDLNPEHIAKTKARYGSSGRFECRDVADLTSDTDARFDRILFSGLLHHLDDPVAQALLDTCKSLLAPGGRIVRHEPLYVQGQHWFAKLMKDRDSGQNIRTEPQYRALFCPPRGTALGDHLRQPAAHPL